MWGYYKKFFGMFWKDFIKSTGEQVIGALLIVAILVLQIHYGVIKPGEIQPNALSVAWPYTALIGAFFVYHLIRAPWKVHQKQQNELSIIKEFKEGIENTKPRIVRHPTESEHVIHSSALGVPVIRIRFINKPITNTPNGVAYGVRANVSFFYGEDLALEMKGRWATSDEPPSLPLGTSWNVLDPVNFGIGEQHVLDIAFREPGGDFIAWNNESYAYPDRKKPGHRLRGKEYKVRVALFGAFVEEEFFFWFSKADSDMGIMLIKNVDYTSKPRPAL